MSWSRERKVRNGGVRAICFKQLKMRNTAGVDLTFPHSAGSISRAKKTVGTSEGEEMVSSYCEVRAMYYLCGLVTDGCFVLFVFQGASTTCLDYAGVANKKSTF
jgi:hypothetical protein